MYIHCRARMHPQEKRSSLVWHYREVDNSLGDATAPASNLIRSLR